MTVPILGYWRRLGLSPRFYVVLVAVLTGFVGGVYVGLSSGHPEMARLMIDLVLDLAPAVVGLALVGGLVVWLIYTLFGR